MGKNNNGLKDALVSEIKKRNKAIQTLKDSKKEYSEKGISKLKNYQKEEMSKLSKKAIDSFYGSYNQKVYSRTGNLYNAYKIEEDSEGNYISNVDENFIPNEYPRLNSSDYIYETVFKEGWHGGSDSGKGYSYPYYKPGIDDQYSTPRLYDGEDGKPYSSGKWGWAKAKKSTSPYKKIKKDTEEFYKKNGKNDKKKEEIQEPYFELIKKTMKEFEE